MKKYKMIKHPQSNEGVKIEYTMSNDLILKSEIFKYVEEEFQSEKTIYFDLSSLKDNVHYIGEYPVSSVITTETEIAIEVINTVGDEWTDDEANPEWFDIIFEDFDIPEDIELIYLEELVIPEQESNTIEKLEADNRALTLRVEELKKQMEADQKSNEEMTLELLELMMGLV